MKKSKIIIISAIIVAIIGIYIAKQFCGELHEHDENCWSYSCDIRIVLMVQYALIT